MKFLQAVTMTDPGVVTKVKIIIRMPEAYTHSQSIVDAAEKYLLKALPGIQVHKEFNYVARMSEYNICGYHIL